MRFWDKQTWLIILVSVIFIAVPILSSVDIYSGRSPLQSEDFLQKFFGTILVMVFFYFNYYYLIPKLHNKETFWLYLFVVMVCGFVIVRVPHLIFPEASYSVENPTFWHRLVSDKTFYEFLISVLIAILLQLNKQMSIIGQEKLKSEVAYLKAQINPHFMFNTLNSLYALTLEKSDEAPEAILKLSDIMRYVVIESGNEKVELRKEINYIKSYIELQKLRLDTNTDFQLHISGQINSQKITPLIFIPFIENAFKYGLRTNQKNFIHIQINIFPQSVEMSIENSKSSGYPKNHKKSHTGIQNTKKRLMYIYPNQHKLKINDGDNSFHVYLKINIENDTSNRD